VAGGGVLVGIRSHENSRAGKLMIELGKFLLVFSLVAAA
jgi:hypothetical protein